MAKLPRPRPVAADQVWHDTATGDLEADGVSLSERRDGWQLQRMYPNGGKWPPGTPPALLAAGVSPEEMGQRLPGPLMPVAAFKGKQRVILLGPEGMPSLTLIEGTLRGVTQERAVCRIVMEGGAEQLASLSGQLAAVVRLSAPRSTLAGEAIALARGRPTPARRDGAPTVPPGSTLGDAVSIVVSHLADVILASSAEAAVGASPEPVHRMRVAVRRLRSAQSVFRRAADAPAMQALRPGLHDLASRLGVARDWDVFLEGAGEAVLAAFPDEPRVAGLLAAARRRRSAAYEGLGEYLNGPDFSRLEVALVQAAALRPWEAAADEDQQAMLAKDAAVYATALLSRRLEHILAPGVDIEHLPIEELHAIRKDAKRLRYAAEFFALLFPRKLTRRFIEHLADLQEELGHLNDGAAARTLMARLAGRADRAYAIGTVEGFVAARTRDSRRRIARAWSRFRKQEPFWS